MRMAKKIQKPERALEKRLRVTAHGARVVTGDDTRRVALSCFRLFGGRPLLSRPRR